MHANRPHFEANRKKFHPHYWKFSTNRGVRKISWIHAAQMSCLPAFCEYLIGPMCFCLGLVCPCGPENNTVSAGPVFSYDCQGHYNINRQNGLALCDEDSVEGRALSCGGLYRVYIGIVANRNIAFSLCEAELSSSNNTQTLFNTKHTLMNEDDSVAFCMSLLYISTWSELC